MDVKGSFDTGFTLRTIFTRLPSSSGRVTKTFTSPPSAAIARAVPRSVRNFSFCLVSSMEEASTPGGAKVSIFFKNFVSIFVFLSPKLQILFQNELYLTNT